ncbi:hypothetical protein [Massilia sp.]|uniref:hypothetical protein n=1 Tax=Massilia sp. TaxID=1882437 RepID=UPI0028A11752|nr:hypothetical protein [Massilia sp.]
MDQLSKAGSTRWRILALVGLALLLASCKTPFSNRLSQIDWAGSRIAGTIAVSQPKMYRRESLINERRRDVGWIEGMLDPAEFAKVKFDPEMQREIEQITAFAAAIGLSFDPARGAEYRRESETDAIQHKIDVLELQLQLDQLIRDAELMRARFAAQTEPSDRKPGDGAKAPDGAKPQEAGAADAALPPQLNLAIDQLKAAIVKFTDGLATRLDASASDVKRATSAVNPNDQFRDKLAYRDLLKSALNTASLDDLHDFGGSALIRLNFQAVVLPERDRSRRPGVVQMTIKPPPPDAPDWDILYRRWLDHINQRLNRATGDGWGQDPELVALSDSDLFTLIDYYFPRPNPQPGPALKNRPTAGDSNARPDAIANSACDGYAVRTAQREQACAKLVFAVPRFVGGTTQEGAYSSLDNYLRSFQPYASAQAQYDATVGIHAKIPGAAPRLVKDCHLPVLPPKTPAAPSEPDDADDVLHAIRRAQQRVVAADEIARVERAAQHILGQAGVAAGYGTGQARLIAAQASEARFLLRTFEDTAYRACSRQQRIAFRNHLPRLYRPRPFEEIVSEQSRIAVYEIGPRELVQQISSVSRVANNLSLALSLAAAAPRTGASASAAANYSRQAIGKSATFERIPSLIGYAAQDNRFGWVIMPRAVFDPKGDILLEQEPRTMDLAVDLSIPAWWPYFDLVTATGWGPDAAAIDGGAPRLDPGGSMRVPMKANYADFEQMTVRMQRGAQLQIQIDDPTLKGQHVSACRVTTLYVRGAHLWRASAAVIGGHRLANNQLDVAPDMSGILLTVPALAGLTPVDGVLPLSIYTRDGEATGSVAYVAEPQPGICPALAKVAASDAPKAPPAKVPDDGEQGKPAAAAVP